VNRRDFLLALAAGTAVVAGCSDGGMPLPKARPTPDAARPVTRTDAVAPSPRAGAVHPHRPARPAVVHRPPPEVLTELSGNSRRIALTIDDGVSSYVVGTLIDFVKASGIRVTMFPNGVYSSWTDHAKKLRPLVERGQVQLGNHTWSHPDLTSLSDKQIAYQIRRNEQFLHRTFGVDPAPYLRPPYGFHNKRTDQVAADLGYRLITMWYGVLGDGTSYYSPDQLVANARQWFDPGRIVIGHANQDPITHVYGQLLDLLRARRLQTVTLADVFGH
jgi:peptidoglycan/xylan/chitin deacetylase (PgdA/CDA1 family)